MKLSETHNAKLNCGENGRFFCVLWKKRADSRSQFWTHCYAYLCTSRYRCAHV